MNQLRIRTEYSFGETFAPIERVVNRLVALDAMAGGIADSGTWGHVKWDAAMRAAKMAPMFGVTLGAVPNLESEDRPTMWFLARTDKGLQELYHYSSLAQKQMMRGVARLTFAQVLSMSGEIFKFAGQITEGDFLKECGAYIDFDPVSQLLNKRKRQLLGELKSVVISDNNYADIADRQTFNIIGKQDRISAQHLLSTDEMELELNSVLTPSQFTRSLENIKEICAEAGTVKLPKAKLISVVGDLEALARSGIEERKMRDKGIWTDAYEKRLVYELEMIRSKKFESYFLMVAEMVRYAKTKMLVGPSRGSAAGSLVCYLTRITEIDPIPSKLIFERFIDVTREDLPDIDLDFVDSKRYMVIEFLRSRYGAENVAQIGTVSTYQPKSALGLIAKKASIPPWDIDPVKDSIFERSSGDSRANFALLDTLEQTDPGRALLLKHPIMMHAAAIEAHASNSGVHAAGILVCNDAIENFCTVTADGVAQLDKKDAEKLNLLKIDALGLRTLGVLEDSGVPVDWYDLTFDDPLAFKVINDHRFSGVFQFEGRALQAVALDMEVLSLDDLGHITALARPGPMASGGTTTYLLRRAGKEKFNLPHPALAPFVADTFGVVIYQEQVLSICRQLGNMDWATVTLLRKAMSKTLGKEYFDQFRSKFLDGARAHNIPDDASNQIWEGINTMGCLSGETLLRNPFPNHATPKKIKLSSLAENNGYIRQRAKFKNSPRVDSKAEPYEILKRQQLYALNPQTSKIAPARCSGAISSGVRVTVEVRVESGEKIRATLNHKFFTKRGWQRVDQLVVGDSLAMVGVTLPTPRKTKKGTGSGAHNWIEKKKAGGEMYTRNLRILRKKFNVCQNCRSAPYQETHHINLDSEDHRLRNLLPVCRSCHRRLHGPSHPHSRGKEIRWEKFLSISRQKAEEVFDVQMPADLQNFEANGFIVHNSWAFNLAHSYSYAVVSYWTMWLKAHHLLEFSAATLRNAMSDDSAIKMLRELVNEGINYIPFDPELSQENWSVQGDKLVGGFMGIRGIGSSKAKTLVADRTANGGLLPESKRQELIAAEKTFGDIFPTESRFGEYYSEPQKFGIREGTKVVRIEQITGEAQFVYIGKLKRKDLRDHNETIRVQKRGGKKKTGPTLFLDLDLADDTGMVLTRIERYDFEEIGRQIWDNAVIGSWWLVRGKRQLWGRPDGGFKMIYVDKIKLLEDPLAPAVAERAA